MPEQDFPSRDPASSHERRAAPDGPSPSSIDPARQDRSASPPPGGSPAPTAARSFSVFFPASLRRNKLTLAGAALAYLSIIFLGSFLLIDMVSHVENPYVGVWFYLVLPPFLVLGLLLMPAGVLWERLRLRRRLKTNGESAPLPRLDLNLTEHRKALKFTIITTLFVIPIVAMTSYHGYHYTDSTQFCAQVCHQVMEPQFVAQQQSPHARVGCVECHIGSGAEWYVKSKLSGVRQVWAVWRDSYHRPIPPAITELRPAVETCQECHWPEKFYGDQLKRIAHYDSDEGNTPRPIEMIVKTGGGDPKRGPAHGIHWHMALNNRIEYVALDEELQDIPWVMQTTPDGRKIIYRSDGKASTDPKPEGIERTLDCMDCHNRAAHDFYPPNVAVDVALDAEGMIDPLLPYIKRQAVAVILEARQHPEDADAFIENSLTTFYAQNYPRVSKERSASIQRTVEVIQNIYRSSFFSEMKVDWRSYPNNIGHKNFLGCFRCHNGDHVADDGSTIQRTCSSCHVFLEKESVEEESMLIKAGRFVHPVPLVGAHAATACSNCHTGGADPQRSCDGCHTLQTGLAGGNLPGFERFQLTAGPLANHACVGCHDLTKPSSLEPIVEHCVSCHGSEEEGSRQVGMLREWEVSLRYARIEVDTAFQQVRDYVKAHPDKSEQAVSWLAQNEPLLKDLKKANPYHNAAAALRVFHHLAEEARRLLDSP